MDTNDKSTIMVLLDRLIYSKDEEECRGMLTILGDLMKDKDECCDLIMNKQGVAELLLTMMNDANISPEGNGEGLEALMKVMAFGAYARPNFIELLVSKGETIIQKIVVLTAHPNSNVSKNALLLLGHIASGTDEQTRVVLKQGTLRLFRMILTKPVAPFHAMLRIISNASAIKEGPEEVIASDLLPFIWMCTEGDDDDLKRECAWILDNLIFNGSTKNLRTMIKLGVLSKLEGLLIEYPEDAEISEKLEKAVNKIKKHQSNPTVNGA